MKFEPQLLRAEVTETHGRITLPCYHRIDLPSLGSVPMCEPKTGQSRLLGVSWQVHGRISEEKKSQPSAHCRCSLHYSLDHFHFRDFSVRLRKTLTTGVSKSKRSVAAPVQSQDETSGDPGNEVAGVKGVSAWPS